VKEKCLKTLSEYRERWTVQMSRVMEDKIYKVFKPVKPPEVDLDAFTN